MSIIQGITLTTYGNAFLKENHDISDLTLDHRAFIFNNKVDFQIIKKGFFTKPRWVEYASTPIVWLRKLKEASCLELRMVYSPDNSQAPDHQLAGFVGGGGHRFIETVFDNHSDFWQYKTELTRKDDPEKKIWTSSYGRVMHRIQTKPKKNYELNEQKEKLREVLINIISFAVHNNEIHWANIFKKAMLLLDETSIIDNFKLGITLPKEKMTLLIMQLYNCATASNVFGGMGSWNDIGFNDPEVNIEYDKVSTELYYMMNETYLAIANS